MERNKLHSLNIKIKRRSKVQEKNMSCERALNFDQWKTFSENFKPMRVRLWLVYKFYRELLSLATFLRVHSNWKEVSYLSWQNAYPNLKTTCHVKLKFVLWTKLLENSLIAKYLISVAAPLIIPIWEQSNIPKTSENFSLYRILFIITKSKTTVPNFSRIIFLKMCKTHVKCNYDWLQDHKNVF